ncbi:hypothetical protein AVEN_32949-1 [Araneus ventricosus]|uniref:Uncharacterized protein n=1 Tax=Araneus ventricosus TaxID=182803 RepID=A0A4Y2INW8_ARAVE|nr:hypothetical protein AVEN_32949-1 [Araneus ventricosus]
MSDNLIKEAIKDKLLPSKLTIFRTVACELGLIERFVGKDVLMKNSILEIDINDIKSLCTDKQMDLGISTLSCIRKSQVPEKDATALRKECMQFLLNCLQKMRECSPLIYSLTKAVGSPSLGGYGCPNPEVPRDLSSLPIYPPLCLLLSAAYFHPSTASEGALHEKLLPLCLLLASHGQPKTPRVGRAWRPFRREVHHWSPVYQFGWYPNHLVGLLGIKRKGHSLGLGVKGGQRSWR